LQHHHCSSLPRELAAIEDCALNTEFHASGFAVQGWLQLTSQVMLI